MNRLAGPSNTQGALQENGATLQNYGYDPNGNWYLSYYNTSLISAPTLETPQSASWFLANNQINGWAYDSAGNETGIPASAGSTTRAACATNTMAGVAMMRTSCFDAETRMISETDVNGTTTTYAYDGDGHRVSKNVNGVVTTFVYDAFGNLVAEYGGAPNTSGTSYVSVDHLGSTRLLADSSGVQQNCFDYLPFGGDLFAGTDGGPSCYPSAYSAGIRFTGKERDAETGIDLFGFRYMSPHRGDLPAPTSPSLTSMRGIRKVGTCTERPILMYRSRSVWGVNSMSEAESRLLDILSSEELPPWFHYPRPFLRLIETGIREFDPWWLFGRDYALQRMTGLRSRYPDRELVPFARNQSNDDVACWDRSSPDRVQIIHDRESSPFEQGAVYDTFWDWLRSAIEDFIQFEP